MNPNTLTIIFGVIATLSVVFGIYQYYASRKFARLAYEYQELADFKLPSSFYDAVHKLPVKVTILSVGNKAAENIFLHVKTREKIIEAVGATDTIWSHDLRDREATITIQKLNPDDEFCLLLYCEKGAISTNSILTEIKITMLEGKVLNKREMVSAKGIRELVFSLIESTPSILSPLLKITWNLRGKKSKRADGS